MALLVCCFAAVLTFTSWDGCTDWSFLMEFRTEPLGPPITDGKYKQGDMALLQSQHSAKLFTPVLSIVTGLSEVGVRSFGSY